MDIFLTPIDLAKIPIEAVNPSCTIVLVSSFQEHFSLHVEHEFEKSEKMLFVRVAGQLMSF